MQNNIKFLQKQIRLLHSRTINTTVLKRITSLKKISFEYLLDIVSNKELTDYQAINIIKILFMMRNYDYNLFSSKIIDLTLDSRISIRSYSTVALVTILYLEKNYNKEFIKKNYKEVNFISLQPKDKVVKILKKAIESGIYSEERKYVERYINQNDCTS